MIEPVLIGGAWRRAEATETYHAFDPTAGVTRDAAWPVSEWSDVDAALDAARAVAAELSRMPGATIARFLERYAERLEARGSDLVAAAHAETGLAVAPRLRDVELPRMLDQLRQAAAAAREGTWRMAMIDTKRNIRSAAFGLGPVVVLPPANFPFAFGAVTGGDFAAAIVGGNPVIAKAHPGHPEVSKRAAEEALQALKETGLPAATVQLVHGVADGERLVSDPRVGGIGFTGSERVGRKLFAAASAAGRVIWVEMGAINPVVLLSGALGERGDEIAGELATSITGSAGQLCTKPGVVFLVEDAVGKEFIEGLARRLDAVGPQVLLGPRGRDAVVAAVESVVQAGAQVRAGGRSSAGPCSHLPTLLEVSGAEVIARPDALLIEAFGNVTLLVRCRTLDELLRALGCVTGSLAASVYTAKGGSDEAGFSAVAALLLERAGRVIENRMPTGLAVTAAMQHGGRWPSAGPPFFSAVGMPWTALRFARRICFDGWSEAHLPEVVRDAAPAGRPWRFIDGEWRRNEPA